MQFQHGILAPALAILCLAGCVATRPAPAALPAAMTEANSPSPAGAAPGLCYSADRTPARIETVTEQVLLRPAVKDASGKEITPASYRSETRQRVLEAPQPLLFETPCAAAMTPELIRNLQRALEVRGLYRGRVDGVMGPALRQSIRAWQRPAHGIDSAILSMVAARSLGLIAWERDKL